METENIERIIEKEDEVHQKPEEEEKSANEEEEESDANNEENTQNLESNHQTEQSQENEQEKEEKNNEQNLDEKEKGGVVDPYATTTYILKYRRTKEELKELAVETNLPKSESCYFMINIKLTKSDNADMTNSNTDISNENIEPEFLVISCHEIAAIYMDEIYERKYTLNDLCKEIKYFKIFDKIEEARNVIDESLKNNEKNPKKIFVDFKNKELKLHMKLSYWDREKETMFTIPKKILSEKEKNSLLPEFLKEIQQKMNHLKDENKKLKAKNIILQSSKGGSDFLIESDFKKDNDLKVGLMNENIEDKINETNIETRSIKKKIIKKKKIKKKINKDKDKDTPKKVTSPEENYF
jgi:hypothetical protein